MTNLMLLLFTVSFLLANAYLFALGASGGYLIAHLKGK